LDHLNAFQIAEWEAYDKIDPIGTWRDDFRFAKLTALIQNIVNTLYCEKGKEPILVSIIDEMPDWLDEKETSIDKKQSVEEMKGILLSIANTQNKREARKKTQRPPPRKLKKVDNSPKNL